MATAKKAAASAPAEASAPKKSTASKAPAKAEPAKKAAEKPKPKQDKDPEPEGTLYDVIRPIVIDGEEHGIGDQVALSDLHGAELHSQGYVRRH